MIKYKSKYFKKCSEKYQLLSALNVFQLPQLNSPCWCLTIDQSCLCEASMNLFLVPLLYLPLYLPSICSFTFIYVNMDAHVAHAWAVCTCDSRCLLLYGTHAQECHGPGCKWLRHFATESFECFISCRRS